MPARSVKAGLSVPSRGGLAYATGLPFAGLVPANISFLPLKQQLFNSTIEPLLSMSLEEVSLLSNRRQTTT